MNELARLWIAALRSGEFKQGKFGLKCGDTYCCLGVAARVYEKEMGVRLEGWGCGTLTGAMGCVRSAMGLTDDWGNSSSGACLSRMNDEEGLTFEEIADALERDNGFFEQGAVVTE